MAKQFREAQIEMYIDCLVRLSFRYKDRHTTENLNKLGSFKVRMKRELKRTFELSRPINEGEK